MANNAAFRAAFSKVISRSQGRLVEVVRSTMIEMGSSIVDRTPVRSGRARANWCSAIGSPDYRNDIQADPSAAGARATLAKTLTDYKLGDTIYFTNSVPYAKRLEEGWSKQAPSGMVKLTIQNYATILRRVAEGL